MSGDRLELIDTRLRQALEVERLEIEDEGHLHVGHPGARAGGGHFRILVVSADFAGHSRLQRHRRVYAALGEAMRPDVIHALSIRALTPEEFASADS